jgi:membrane fusion protein, heavy metal efflux system
MNRPKLFSILGGLFVICAIAYLGRSLWSPTPASEAASSGTSETKTSSNKIIVGEQAQKNLRITAQRLKVDNFWRSIAVPGMVVDRPGVSDRDVVAPATGVVTEIAHVPGDLVSPGDVLFTLKLASETLQQTQTELFKASQDIKLAEARHKRLAAAGEAIAQARLTEIESEITRLQSAVEAYRQELTNRGFSRYQIDDVANGKLLGEISVAVPPAAKSPDSSNRAAGSETSAREFEVQQLKVDLGEQVQAGQALCHLSNHQSLAIEGRAFRDEIALLEQNIKKGLPVDVDFQELPTNDWPEIKQVFSIRYLANTLDPPTRTFSFLAPLENQSKKIERNGKTQLLWRFRPGQKVQIKIRTEELKDVFVLPAESVVFEGADAFVFTQNVNTFERKGVHVLFRDRDHVVISNDGSLPTYPKGEERRTVHAIVQIAAAQLNRMAKAGSSSAPKGYHIHADGSLHKNEDEGK